MATRISTTLAPLIVLAGWLTAASAAEPDLSNDVPLCDGKFGLCRYVDKNTRQELIPARFEFAMPFSEGLAGVGINGRFGYIDGRGEVVIQPRFDVGAEFRLGLAEVQVGGNVGIIDRTGQVVIPLRFRRAVPLTKDVFIASEGPSRRGYPEALDRFGYSSIEGAGLYHISGRWIRPPAPELKEFRAFETEGRGLVWVTVRGDKSDLVGLMASDGSWVIEPQYSYAGRLLDGRAIVRKTIDGVMHSGAVDANGELVVPLKPWLLFYWRNGQAIAQEGPGSGRKQALVDESGNIIGGRWFDKVERAETGDIAVVWIGDRAVGLDRTGNIVDNPRNGRVTASCPNGIRAVEIDGHSQITDADGRPTSPHLFRLISGKLACDRPTSVNLDGKWGYVGLDGRLLFDPPRFDNQHDFSGGTAVVQQNGKWGIIDTAGRFTVEVKFDRYAGTRDGLFHMQLNGRDIWIDATGNEKPEPPPVRYGPTARVFDCGHDVRLFSRDGLWGIADGDQEIIAPKYRAMVCFRNGIAWAPVDGRRQWCSFGPDGAERDRPACTAANYPVVVTHHVPEKFHDDPFENSVLWTRTYLEYAAGKRDSPPRWVSDGMR